MHPHQESPNAIFRQFVAAISSADRSELTKVTDDNVSIEVPGAEFVDITSHAEGVAGLCDWAQAVRNECGKTTFEIHRYFENGCELMAGGSIRIERFPRVFESPCAFHVRFEAGKVVEFQLLLDSYALQRFRGQMD